MEFEKVYTVRAQIDKQAFLRKALVYLSTLNWVPTDIVRSQFGEVKESEKEIVFCAAHAETDYSASVGYDRQETYIDKVKEYDNQLHMYVMKEVQKTRTVTDWQPHSGHHASDVSAFLYNEKNDEDSGLLSLDEKLRSVMKIVVNDNLAEEGGSAVVSAEGYQQIEMVCKIEARSGIGYPGDRHKDEHVHTTLDIQNLECYKVPYYTVEFTYGGKKYSVSGFALGDPHFEGEFPRDNKIVDEVAAEKSRGWKAAKITGWVLFLALYLASCVMQLFGLSWFWTLPLGMMLVAILVHVIANKKQLKILRNIKSDNVTEKLNQLKRALQDRRFAPLSEEELKLFDAASLGEEYAKDAKNNIYIKIFATVASLFMMFLLMGAYLIPPPFSLPTNTKPNTGGSSGGSSSTETEIPSHTHLMTHYARVAPDCTTAGNIEYWSCSRCGKKFTDQYATQEVTSVTLKATGHSFVNGVCTVCSYRQSGSGDLSHTHVLTHYPRVSPDCTTAGNIECWYCSDCKKYFSDRYATQEVTSITLKATGHAYATEWSSDRTYHWHAATCGHSDQVDAKGTHTFSGGVCTVCSYRRSETDVTDPNLFLFNETEGGYSILVYNGTETDVVIPSAYNNKPVIAIGQRAFYQSNITSVTIPDSVTSIGYSAFSGCSGLTSVTIGNSVTSIGNSAFYGCSGLTSVTIPDSVTSIGSFAFSGCRGLTSVTIGNGVTSIGDSAFYGCRGLTSELVIPNSVTSIGDYAFSGCSGVTGDLVIPNGVTSIGNSAFGGCSGLTSVTIGDSVTSIRSHAFSGCSGLTSVTIPDSVTFIGNYAFSGCSGLTSVVFKNPNGWTCGGTAFGADILSVPANAAAMLTKLYFDVDWTRN